MLLVITGAGASRDSIHDAEPPYNNFRPPLANELFGRYEHQHTAMARYELGSLATEVQSALRVDESRGVETVLDEYLARASNAGTRPTLRWKAWRTLVSMRYYLRDVIGTVSGRWWSATGNQTHYNYLVEVVDRSLQFDDEEAVWVTFNYDTLLDQALELRGQSLVNMNGYVAGQHKLIKLHGSIDWGRQLVLKGHRNDEDVVRNELTEALTAGGSPLTGHFERWIGDLSGGHLWTPALAVPLTSKDEFECPAGHVEVLSARLSGISRVLAIGWKGGEDTFTAMLKERLPHGVPFDIVGRTNPGKVAGTLAGRGVEADFAGYQEGFSSFITEIARRGALPDHDWFRNMSAF